MTDEAKKVVDALKSCNNQNDCRNCVYDKTEGDCVENMEYAAIKLIEKQSAEIEELRAEVGVLQAERIAMVCKMETALRGNAGKTEGLT